MERNQLRYTVIKDTEQYFRYCRELEELVEQSEVHEEEIELLTVLIERWDDDHEVFGDNDPIQLLKSFMNEHKLRAADLTEILALSKGTVSKILNYQKGLSKQTIRKLSDYFKVRQEAFNRPYELKKTSKLKDTSYTSEH